MSVRSTSPESACPLCGAGGRRYVEAFGDALHRCSSCRLVYVFPFPDTSEMIRRHRDEAYAQHPYFTAGEAAAATGNGLSLHHRFLGVLRQHLPPGARAVDVGAGTGDFAALGAASFHMTAVEPSPYLAERIRRRVGCPVFEGPFEEFGTEQPFDAVLLMDVIEHAADPRRLLQHAAAVLRPAGVLFVCTIDSRALLYRLGPLVWRASRVSAKARYALHRIFCYQHNWYFNRRVLNQLVCEAGFEVIEHRGYEFPLNRLKESPIVLAGLRAIYGIQRVLGANTEQYLLARKRA